MTPQGPGGGKKTLSFYDVLGKLYQQKRTGILESVDAPTKVELHMEEGKLVNLVGSPDPSQEVHLQDVLIKGGFVKEKRLFGLIKQARRKGIPIEDVLIADKVVNEQFLRRITELRIQEAMFAVLQMTRVKWRFRKDPPVPNPYFAATFIHVYQKEYLGRRELWPTIQERIGTVEATFKKRDKGWNRLKTIISRGEGDEDLDDLQGNDRMVYFYLDGTRTLKEVAFLSGIGVVETAKSFLRLMKGLYIERVSARGDGADETTSAEATFSRVLGNILVMVIVAIGVMLFMLFGPPSKLVEVWDSVSSGELSTAPAVIAYEEQLREEAITSYRLVHGEAPPDMQTLVTEGYLRPRDID